MLNGGESHARYREMRLTTNMWLRKSNVAIFDTCDAFVRETGIGLKQAEWAGVNASQRGCFMPIKGKLRLEWVGNGDSESTERNAQDRQHLRDMFTEEMCLGWESDCSRAGFLIYWTLTCP